MKNNSYRLNIIVLLFLLLINAGVYSLPASFFLLEPLGLKNSIFTTEHSVFRIESSDEDFSLPETASQKIISSEKNNGKVTVLLQTGRNSLGPGNDLSRHLKNTPFLNTDSAEIKKAASRFSHSKDPLKDISVFVYNHISDKKIGIPMSPAKTVLKQKTGDCTEHSILTAALLRSLNIPARAVVGVILTESFGGKKNVFVYHMWIEAFKNGKWVMLDSTRPLNVHPNRYIALAYHNLMTETPVEFLNAAEAVNGMKIYYIR